MIKVIERKTSIQIHCTRADWPLVRKAMDQGLSYIFFEHHAPERPYLEPNMIDEACVKAWKRNGCPQSIGQFIQIDKS